MSLFREFIVRVQHANSIIVLIIASLPLLILRVSAFGNEQADQTAHTPQ